MLLVSTFSFWRFVHTSRFLHRTQSRVVNRGDSLRNEDEPWLPGLRRTRSVSRLLPVRRDIGATVLALHTDLRCGACVFDVFIVALFADSLSEGTLSTKILV